MLYCNKYKVYSNRLKIYKKLISLSCYCLLWRNNIICSPKFKMAVHWFVLNVEYSTNINRFDVDKIKYSVKIIWYYEFLVE
jgi:hypothetical protein